MFKRLFLVICLIVVGGAAFLYLTRSALYNYNVAADYEYDFTDKQATITALNIEGGTVTLPEKEDISRSSFLEISVRSNLLSKILMPSVMASDGTSSEVEFYEHGAMGKRYVNISKFVENGAAGIRLTGKYLTVDNGPVQLIQFENIALEGKRVLVLAPHPDDAEIAAFGLYSGHDDVYVVTVTAGDAGVFMYDEIYSDPATHFLKKGEVRTWNSLTVPMLGGVHPEKILNLGYNDDLLKEMEADRNFIAAGRYTDISNMDTYRSQNSSSLAEGLEGINNWSSLVGNLVYLLNEIKPDIIVAPSPKLDRHPDHQYATHALLEALKQIDRHDGHLLLYTNHQVGFNGYNERYPYGDAGALISLPPTPHGANHFGRLYSHPMSNAEQKSKIFALDAMNDLRLGTDFRFPLLAIKQASNTLWTDLTGANTQYFRRAVRSNEFFYVVDIEDIYDDEKLGDL